MTWGFVTYTDSAGHELAGALRIADNTVVALPDSVTASFANGLTVAMDTWADWSPQLHEWDPSGSSPLDGAHLLAPLRYPRKVICAGANYGNHIAEMGASEIPSDWKAWFFQKPPTTTVVGPTDDVIVNPDPAEKLDWEGELGIIIGAKARAVSVADAPSIIAGYTVVNDISARGPHFRATSFARPFDFDWLASKGQDTFCPIGPAIVPWWVIDPSDLQLKLWVNDDLKQNESTSDMILNCAELVAAASELVTLEPGDLIATGTPSGVGASTGTFLADGDVVTVEIAGLGKIVNHIRHRQP